MTISSEASLPVQENAPAGAKEPAITGDAKPESIASTLVTSLACLICVGICVSIATSNQPASWETLLRFGVYPSESIWRGKFWTLVTSAFVHTEIWHVACNVYWLWVLGSRLERTIGSFLFLSFILASAFVSSAFQLALSDSSGIGASGVVYSVFGFMWLSRGSFPLFKEALHSSTILLFIIWLFGCLAVTLFNIFDIGNAAHFSGLLFGSCVAGASVLPPWRALGRSMTGIVVAIAILLLFWCPWSPTWLSIKAYDAHVAGRYQEAVEQYTRVIRVAPQNAWAFLNRSYAYQALGNDEQAGKDSATAHTLDPTLAPNR